jgi:hypothetical protein
MYMASSKKKSLTPAQSTSLLISGISILFLGFMFIMYRVFQDFIYNYLFVIKKTLDIAEVAGEMRVGKFAIFLGLWILVIIFNMSIFSIVFKNKDYKTQVKLTSLLYVGIVATTFLMIGMIPGLVEVFENTFGAFIVSTFPTSWLFGYDKLMKVFKSKAFSDKPEIKIPFGYLLPMFNVNTFNETFNAIDGATSRHLSGEEKKGNADDPTEPEKYDFWFDYSQMCDDENSEKLDSKGHFKNELFKLCFAKHNAGHFMWAYIASIVTMLSTVAAM